MDIRNAVEVYIVASDPNNGGPISYTADDVLGSNEFAAECLRRGAWSDGTAINDVQRRVLQAVVAGRDEVNLL